MKKRDIVLTVLAVIAALGIACGAYLRDYYPAEEAAFAAMEGSKLAQVQQMEDMAVFASQEPKAGLVFYPGGKVEYTAYAPLMLELAERDILCVLVEMPGNLAVLDANAALEIPGQFPEVERWYIGGHSLGGSMAASCARGNEGVFDGLVMLAAYATGDMKSLETISLYGTEDGVLDMEKYEKYRENLPEDWVEIVIAGGNHAQFGSYGPQEGDGTAQITAQEQIEVSAAEIADFILKN